MNPTIEKIVGLLFEDLAETEETIAIREEVLQNCQDRYQDLRDAGISEDDAIHAVIESLSGMEEMLKDYPRRKDAPPEVAEPQQALDAGADEVSRTWTHDPAVSPVHEIYMENMGSADVFVRVSEDQLIHVECSNPEMTLITEQDNGILKLHLSMHKEEEIKDEIKFSLQDGFDLSSLGRMIERLTKKLTLGIRGRAEITLSVPALLCPALKIGTSSGSVTVGPLLLQRLTIGSASGDAELTAVRVQKELRVTSASGDITISGAEAQEMQLSTTSGDIEAGDCLIGESVKLNTTSGDISWGRQCRTLSVNSISGDVTLDGQAESISFRTVSGDVEITPAASQLLAISGCTTSGDVDISLPEDIVPDVSCSTVSGDVSNRAGCVPGAPVTIKVSAVSGDIKIR